MKTAVDCVQVHVQFASGIWRRIHYMNNSHCSRTEALLVLHRIFVVIPKREREREREGERGRGRERVS